MSTGWIIFILCILFLVGSTLPLLPRSSRQDGRKNPDKKD